MGNLFGVKRRALQVTAQDRAILQLKQQRDKIKIYQKKIEADLETNKELALKLYQNNMKERALIVLRRKRNMEDVLTRTDKQLETLESLVTDIEYTQIQVSVVEGLRVGTEALKQLNTLMNIEDIQQMMDDSAEAAEKQREISAILSQTSERYDDDDLLKELEHYKEKQDPLIVSAPQRVEMKPESENDASIEDLASQAGKEKLADITTAETNHAVFVGDKLDNLPHVPKEEQKTESEDRKRNYESPRRGERQMESA